MIPMENLNLRDMFKGFYTVLKTLIAQMTKQIIAIKLMEKLTILEIHQKYFTRYHYVSQRSKSTHNKNDNKIYILKSEKEIIMTISIKFKG